ncbi:MAG: DUF3782 domain-containing protein [Zestosphaera sp.]
MYLSILFFRVNLRGEFLRLLDEDREFRLMVAGKLGYGDVLRRLERHDRKFNKVVNEIKKFREDFNTEMSKLRGDFNAEMKKLREDFNKLSMRVEVTIGSMGRGWGEDLERMVLEIFREELEKRGIEPGKVEKLRFTDRDGSITGVRGRIVDIDVSVRDGKLYLVEVKSRAELDHVEALYEKVRAVEKYLAKSVSGVFLVAVNVDKEAYDRARQLGIEVICGSIIE